MLEEARTIVAYLCFPPQGFFSGFAKGMVGTVTKPAIGFLDLASSTSLAVRDTSKKYGILTIPLCIL